MNKILFVTNRYHPYVVGGAEITVQTVAEELARRGKEIVVVSLSAASQETIDVVNGIRVYRVVVRNVYAPFGPAQPFFKRLIWHLRDINNTDAARKLGEILDVELPDVVSTHNLGGFGVALWKEVRARGIRLIHTVHDYYLLCPRVSMFRRGKNCVTQCASCYAMSIFKRRASRDVEVLIGISRFVLNAHLQRNFFPNAQSRVIYNSRVWLQHQGLRKLTDSNVLHFGFIGRIEPEKGIEILLDALSKMPSVPWILKIAGRAGDANYMDYLRDRYPLSQVQFVGFVRPEEFYPCIDVLVVPSIWNEPLGVVAFEAMGFGVPVVASRQGGLPEIVEGSGAGWLFDVGDVSNLSAVLGEVIRSRARLREMRAACLRRREAFLPVRHADEFLEALRCNIES